VNGVQFGLDFGSGQGKSEWSLNRKNFSPLISKRSSFLSVSDLQAGDKKIVTPRVKPVLRKK
jgi:hypothetical protein